MELYGKHPARRFEEGQFSAIADSVVTEARIELDLNDGQLRLAMLCLPRDLEALAVGFLLGEGVLRRPEDLTAVEPRPAEGKVLLRGDFDAQAMESLARRWTWGSGCGGGGTSRDLDRPAYQRVGVGSVVQPQTLLDLLHQFQLSMDLWRETGGVHACALADNGRILLLAEDVGRHNAFDKVMGLAALKGIGVEDKFILTTGRLSAEIVSKAVACRVPMLVSRCAVTSLALELARRFAVTLVGFVRGRRLNVYSGFQRVVQAGNLVTGGGDESK